VRAAHVSLLSNKPLRGVLSPRIPNRVFSIMAMDFENGSH